MSKPAPVHERFYLSVEELLYSRPDYVRSGIENLGLAAEFFPAYTNCSIHLHSPALVLFSYIVKGHCWHIMGDDVFEETGGVVGITHYGQYHDIVTDPQGVDVINLYLDLTRCPLPHLPSDLDSVLQSVLPVHPCFQNHLNCRTRIVFDRPDEVTCKLFRIEEELKAQQPGYHEAVLLYFKLFLIDCCRQAQKSGVVLNTRHARPRDARLEELRRFLDKHFADPLTLTALAQRVGVTPVYLCRAFKEYTGQSVFDYLLNRRIQEAMIRLSSKPP
jgi:hypothetical protein